LRSFQIVVTETSSPVTQLTLSARLFSEGRRRRILL